MISNISFGSTYKVSSNNNNFDKFSEFQAYASSFDYSDGVSSRVDVKSDSKYPYNFNALYTLITPDNLDEKIESFCASRGIKFEKLYTEDLLKPLSILKRIQAPPKKMIKAQVDSDKLYELIDNQSHNITHCEKDYYKYYSDNVMNMLKSGDEIPATTFVVYPSSSSVENTLEYIDRFGADNLNDNQLLVAFNQKTNKPDHCVFFALRDMGIKSIPVYVNEDTYKLASALGILK